MRNTQGILGSCRRYGGWNSLENVNDAKIRREPNSLVELGIPIF